MSFALIHTRAGLGITAPTVTIEVHLSRGLPAFHIVGLPEAAVKESRERVRSALLQSGFDFPAKRIIINLAPADLPKQGARFDLPIALGILAAAGLIENETLLDIESIGELGLTGDIRPVDGCLPFLLAAKNAKRRAIIPSGNAIEAGLSHHPACFAADHLLEICRFLNQEKSLTPVTFLESATHSFQEKDLSEVIGQHHAKTAIEIAAAGGHSLLFVGPPGTGKTMLASRLPGILPALSDEEALDLAVIQSISGKRFTTASWKKRPFRAPHHSASAAAIVGGGRPPKPGEISLSHHGVLFLDELPEFSRPVLESLREPLESGVVTISRAGKQEEFPAQFLLVAAMNPCPCGQYGNPHATCRCHPQEVQRYYNRLSGPLLDRIDMQIEVPMINPQEILQENSQKESSLTVKARVGQARDLQIQRQGCLNASLQSIQLQTHCKLDSESSQCLESTMQRFGLSMRSYHRILRLARTISDLQQKQQITIIEIKQALNYRCIERQLKRLNDG